MPKPQAVILPVFGTMKEMGRIQSLARTWATAAIMIMALVLAAGSPLGGKRAAGAPPVRLLRVPNGGIQPQVAIDARGVLHLLYFSGESAHGDLYYTRSENRGEAFSAPLRVNSHPGSAMATGNIRGAHIALGKNGRVYAAWNGTYEVDRPGIAKPWMKHPMVFARMNDAGTAFEPERNLIHAAYGLDGGGALAAASAGDVYIFWHAPAPRSEGEANRRVWVARSTDDGQTFAPEKPAFDKPTGACGCCGMSAFVDRHNNVYALYRSASEMIHRDIYLLYSNDRGETFRGTDVAQWNIGACTMSMQDLAQGSAGVLAAWETMGNVFYAFVNPLTGRVSPPVGAPGEARDRKYPSVAGNSRGEILLAWTEGMKWGKGGSVAWQVFDANGDPEGETGYADGVPAWSLVATFAAPDGSFTVVY
jgi:hypothetical protein